MPISKSTLALCAMLPALALSCTDFLLNSPSPTDVLTARSMDHYIDLHNVIEVIPRGTYFYEPIVKNCSACPQYSWNSKYGFVAVNAFGLNAATDGMNEQGLSAAYLQLNLTEYPPIRLQNAQQQQQQQQPNLPIITSICTYFMANFASIDEIKTNLGHIQFGEIGDYSQILGLPLTRFPYHISVHDASGKSLVIEFVQGQTKVYDNTNNVLTNDPPLDQQLAALALSGVTLANMLGADDATSRFQRVSLLNRIANEWTNNLTAAEMSQVTYLVGTDEQRGVANALHVLNSAVRPSHSMTHWSLIRDHARGKLYVQSAQNQVPRRIDLKSLDFTKASSRHLIPMSQGDWFVDVTAPLQDANNLAKTVDWPAKATR